MNRAKYDDKTRTMQLPNDFLSGKRSLDGMRVDLAHEGQHSLDDLLGIIDFAKYESDATLRAFAELRALLREFHFAQHIGHPELSEIGKYGLDRILRWIFTNQAYNLNRV